VEPRHNVRQRPHANERNEQRTLPCAHGGLRIRARASFARNYLTPLPRHRRQPIPFCSITGLISFFLDEAPTAGSISATAEARKALAAKSLEWNVGVPKFAQMFPEFVALHATGVAGAAGGGGAATGRSV